MLVELTKDDYLRFSGIDLIEELKNSNYDLDGYTLVNIVIKRIHDAMVEYLKQHYGFTGVLKDNQKAAFKKALLHQIDYIRRNGELNIDSDNHSNELSNNAYYELKSVGMCNLQAYYV